MVDRVIAMAFILSVIFAPWVIGRALDRIYSQNERIISLLVDIKTGKRDLL